MDAVPTSPKSGECQRFFGYGKKIPKDVKRHCGICRQHGIIVETRGHLCQFKNCDCWKCKLVRQRRSIMSTQIRIRRKQDKKFQRTTDVSEADVVPWNGDSNINTCYFCQKCKNHGVLMWKKDHKKKCEFANCRCEQCDLIDTRRALDRHIKNNKTSHSDNNSTSSSEVSSSNSPVDVESLTIVSAKPGNLKLPASITNLPYLDPSLIRIPLPTLMSPLQSPLLPIVPSLYSPLPIISPPLLPTFPTYPFDLQLMLSLYSSKQF